jgi:membrane protein
VFRFIVKGFGKGVLVTRASSIAFNMLMAFLPASIFATCLFMLTSLGFSAYVNHFGQYNRLYGSIGTLIIIMIWLYLNSIALLIGFELNVSIKAARAENNNSKVEINYSEETGLPVS